VSHKPFSRTVTDTGNGCGGVSIPSELREEYDVEIGDEVTIDRDGSRFIVDLE
jgi:bifunctional DNA-binding transcriptional regulator/antitoxin component of YhaV-PrlF toxin-antitoxin module